MLSTRTSTSSSRGPSARCRSASGRSTSIACTPTSGSSSRSSSRHCCRGTWPPAAPTTHLDLDFPREPQIEPYWCHKHKRECRPVERAEHFVRRYALDTLARIKEFARLRARGSEALVLHGDARTLALEGPFEG